ncbi:hypothetical protein ACLOJK_020994 [Asimina triloba]
MTWCFICLTHLFISNVRFSNWEVDPGGRHCGVHGRKFFFPFSTSSSFATPSGVIATLGSVPLPHLKESWEGGKKDSDEKLGLNSKPLDSATDSQARSVFADQEAGDAENSRKAGGWRTMPYVIGNETFEKVASLSLIANMIVYLSTQFNMKSIYAVNVVNVWQGSCNFAPLVGAFLSDAYLGRFRTLAYSSFATLAGMIVLTLTASIPTLRPPPCHEGGENCIQPSKSQLGVLFTGLGLITIGAGGIRPCNLPFGADQFDASTEKGRAAIDSFFNWYYFTLTAAVIIALTGVVYVQNSISWSLGLAIPAGMLAISIVIFFLGVPVYVYVKPKGSIFTSICKVAVAAFRKRRLALTGDCSQLYDPIPPASSSPRLAPPLPLTTRFQCLNKAVIIESPAEDLDSDGVRRINGWRLCSIQQVEELKRLLIVVPFWPAGIVCSIAMDQQNTFAILQASRMDRRIGPKFNIPPGSLMMFSQLTLTIWIPIYDRLIVPGIRKMANKDSGIPVLERIRIGIAFSVSCMLVAGVIERKRRDAAIANGAVEGTAPLSVMWLVPQFILAGLSDAFASIAQMEFYYKQFPESMRTIAVSLFFCSMATASYLSAAIISVIRSNDRWFGGVNWLSSDNINKNKLDYYYYLLAVLGLLNLTYFSIVSCWFRDEKMTAGRRAWPIEAAVSSPWILAWQQYRRLGCQRNKAAVRLVVLFIVD